MNRNPIELALRGLKNALANWQLVAVRMVEGVVFAALTIIALLATIVPAAVEAGLGRIKLADSEDAKVAVAQFVVENWPLIVWTIGILLLVISVMILIHSFIVAGSSRVYLDAERAAGEGASIHAFEVFRGDAFMAAARRGFWRVFWIYNIGWGIAGLIVAVPPLMAVLLIRFASDTAMIIILTILVLAITVILAIPVGIVTSIWVGRALIDGERSQLSARAAMAAARLAIRADLASHVVVPLLVVIISFSAIGFISGFNSAFASAGDAYAPMQLLGSLVQTAAGALASAWMLASFAALAENPPK